MSKQILAGVAAIWLGLAVSAARAQEPEAPRRYNPAPADMGSWWDGWFGAKPKPDLAKPVPGGATPQRPVALDRAAEQERLLNAYLRRSEVCDRLKQIAYQTNNTQLEQQADQLESLAWSACQEKMRRLLGPSAGVLERPEARSASAALQANTPGGAVPSRASRPAANASLLEGEQ